MEPICIDGEESYRYTVKIYKNLQPETHTEDFKQKLKDVRFRKHYTEYMQELAKAIKDYEKHTT